MTNSSAEYWRDSEKRELSRKRIRTDDGRVCDLVRYEVNGYGVADFVENSGVSDGEFRRSRSMMPFNYMDKTGEDFRWDIYDEDVTFEKQLANSFIVNFIEYQKAGKGLYIHSETKGSGKTMLACCLANELMRRRDICVKFISVPELLERTKMRYKDFSEKEEMDRIRNAELLILDDLGAEMKKEWVDTELFRLIDQRYGSRSVTVFTSNIEIEKLKLNDRIVDRIYSMCIQLNLPEVSIRKMMAKNENNNFLSEVMK